MDLVDDLTRNVWDQQSGESAKAHHAFVAHFLALPNWERSMAAAYSDHLVRCKGQTLLKKAHCPRDWNDWRFRHSWLERASAYDAELVAKDRLLRLHDIETMNTRHAALAVAIQDQILLRLRQLVASGEVLTMGPVALARLLDSATAVERRSRNVATEIIAHQRETTPSGDLLDLSKLSAEQLDVFERLIAIAQPSPPVTEGR